MKIPTAEQVASEIAALKAIRTRVRHYTFSGDDNWAAVQAQIEVLEDDMDEDEISDEWPEEDGSDRVLRESALEARLWLDGEYEGDTDSPSEGWTVLVV